MALSKAEKLSHYAIVMIAISAVVVSIWQVNLSQRHNRLTVRPYLNFTVGSTTTPTAHEFRLGLSNQGYGPAIIKVFEISVDDKIVPHWNAAVDQLPDSVRMTAAWNFDAEDVFAAGGERTLLSLIDHRNSSRMKIRIVYQSIYEEEFEVEAVF